MVRLALVALALFLVGTAAEETQPIPPPAPGSCLLLHGMGEMGTASGGVKKFADDIEVDDRWAKGQDKRATRFLRDALLDCTIEKNKPYCNALWGKLPAKLLQHGACDNVWILHMNTLDIGWDWPVMQQKYCEALGVSRASFVVTHSMGGLALSAALNQLKHDFLGESQSYDYDSPKLTDTQEPITKALKEYLRLRRKRKKSRRDSQAYRTGRYYMKLINGFAGYDSRAFTVSKEKLAGCQAILDGNVTWILDQNPLKGSAAAVWLKTKQKSYRFINNFFQGKARDTRTKSVQDLKGHKELSAAEFSLDPTSVQNWCQKLHPAVPGCDCLFDAAAEYAKGGMCGRSRKFNIEEVKKLLPISKKDILRKLSKFNLGEAKQLVQTSAKDNFNRVLRTRGVQIGVPNSIFAGKSFKRLCICGAGESDDKNNDGMVGLSTCQVNPTAGWSGKVTSDWYLTPLSHEGGTCQVDDSSHAEDSRPIHFFVNQALKARGKEKRPMVDFKYHAKKKLEKAKKGFDDFQKELSGLLSKLTTKSSPKSTPSPAPTSQPQAQLQQQTQQKKRRRW